MMRRVLAWAQENERHLGAIVFLCGFLTDIVTLYLLDVTVVFAIAGGALALASLLVFLTHALAAWRDAPSVAKRSVMVLMPLLSQYLIGNMLSWFFIFYTKSAVLTASWPFLLLLALVLIGNEWFRRYKDRLTFITVLLFFAAYAYAIFALPILAGTLGPWIFLASTLAAIAALCAFIFLLWLSGRQRVRGSLMPVTGFSLAIVAVMVSAYFSGAIPPIPLIMKEGDIYHDVRPLGGAYVVLAEPPDDWWDPRPDVVRTQPGSPLFAFTAIFAPVRFGTTVVHRWQRYDDTAGAWVTQSKVAFPISGGRAQGYRGYSQVDSVIPGEWRVRAETESGQVIGQMRFTVVRASQPPVLHEETH